MPVTRESKTELVNVIRETILQLFKEGNVVQVIADRVADKVAIKSLRDSMSQLETETMHLKTRVNALEQRLRSTCVRITGVLESNGETLRNKISNLFKDKMEVTINEGDISECYRIGRVNPNVNKPRPVYLKLISNDIKSLLMKNKRKLKGSRIMMYEDLTKETFDLYMSCRTRLGTGRVWTDNGRILVKCGDNVRLVKCVAELESISPQSQ